MRIVIEIPEGYELDYFKIKKVTPPTKKK